jgi:translation initiation factor 5
MDCLNDEELFYLASKETTLNDPNYRYKITKPNITTSGKKGNRVTFFENSDYYSKKMGDCSSLFFGKYIGNKISCPSYYDKQKKCVYWKGEYSTEQIKSYLKDFIKIYILCPNCDYPETIMFLNEKKLIGLECKSCGENFLIDKKYMDKTYDYIAKNIN